MHGRVSYKTVAISLLYLYSKSCVAIMQHRRATAASMFQNGISQNTKCDNLDSFPKSSHISVHIQSINYLYIHMYARMYLMQHTVHLKCNLMPIAGAHVFFSCVHA